MLIYPHETRQVFAWNAVDVLIDGGQLQHGEVINVVQGGLIVDFQCVEQRAQFVEYGNVFHSDKSSTHDGEDAEVLLRRHPDGAWIWYPGKLLEHPLRDWYQDALFVEVQRPHGIPIRDLVPWEQVRAPSSIAALEKRRVGEEHFVIRCYALSEEYLASGTPRWREIFLYRLQRLCEVVCTSVSSQRLLYLQRQKHQPLDVQHVKNAYYEARNLEKEGSLLGTSQWIMRIATDSACSEKPRTGGRDNDDEVGLSLPPELLAEVFQSLDSIERIRCRRVCSLWSILLISPAYFHVVRVSGDVEHYGKKLHFVMENIDRVYWIVACFLKCLNSTTQRLVLTDLDAIQCTEVAKMIKEMPETTPVPALIFFNCSFG
ncbi:uncharacterized protein LOC129596740 [Paramacrobiotus metropolitanus]|uniref:uncharacterized protein LOC129596740 n=1 Tax=Paramacrobiotus metropolitanus TaxID=2943436 RepID=UPI0024460AF6|nr:uncharacterized protein LOC129596740 [Paramacrobiotus metropolitanus]